MTPQTRMVSGLSNRILTGVENELRRVLKIQKGEGGKVLLFALLGTLLQAGIALGISIADTLFLTNVGSEKLPIIYIAMPFIMLVSTPLFSFLTSRFGIDKLFRSVLILLATCGILFLFITSLYASKHSSILWISYVVKFYVALWYIYLYTLYWNFIDGYFDILDAKRLFSFFSGGMAIGAMLGGVLVMLFISFLKVEQLFGVWSVLALVALPLVLLLQRKYKKIEAEEGEEKESGFFEQTKRVVVTLKNSRYVMTLICLTFGMLFMTNVGEFQYLGIFSNFEETSDIFSNPQDSDTA